MKRTITLVLTMILLVSLAGCGLFEKQGEMVVYVEEELTDVQARALETELCRLEEVESCSFVSREAALEEFVQQHGQSEAFEGIDASVLRHRYVLTVKTGSLKKLVSEIEAIEGVAEVKYKAFG